MAHDTAEIRDALEGRYVFERELGRGGMATVYLALDLKLHRQVAIKILRPELAASIGNERFLREIEIASRLSHPHILPLHDSGEAGSHLYFAMPYVEGESLRDRLNRENQLPLEEALQIAREVADALGYAHGLGIVHRDIKPENILLSAEHAVVADFGIARAIDVAGGSRLTQTGLSLGTPTYMSPEQAAGESVDGRSDIYALGCVVYEMLVGEPPYTGPNAAAIIARRLSEPLRSLRVVRDGVPAEVEQAVHKALARVPADRFRTADQFARALTVAAAPTRARRAIRSRKPLIAGAAGMALAGAVLLPGALQRFRASVDPAANVIAVVPLVPAGSDTALERLGQDLVITLSSNFQGLEGMQVIDPLTVLASAKGGRGGRSPLGNAIELGRRFGASGVVRGALTRDGTRVRIYLALYATRDSGLVAQASVLGSPDSLAAVTDSATWSLLQQIWRAREPPTPSLAAVTTRSISSLRAFLDGEQAITEGRWVDAEEDYANAVREDSTFALAYWRQTYAKWWRLEQPDSATLSIALARLPQLPNKDRLLAEIWAQNLREPATKERLERARILTERFPDYWPGWFQYADMLFHIGPLMGRDLRQASGAFQKVLQLNPRLVPAWDHLVQTAMMLEDSTLFVQSWARLDSLMPRDPGGHPPARIVLPLHLHLVRDGSFDGPLADSLVSYAVAQGVQNHAWLAIWLSWNARPAAQIDLSRRVLARSPEPAVAAIHRKAIALAWAARGDWDSALAAMDAYAGRASELEGLSDEQMGGTAASPDLARLDPYRLAVTGAWLGTLNPRLAAARRGVATKAVARMASPWRQAELFWLDGLLAVSSHDLDGLRQAQGHLRRSDSTSGRVPLRSLAAFELELLGRRREAADSMAALSSEWDLFVGPYSLGISRMAAARWSAAERDLDKAISLLPWHQSIVVSVSFIQGAVVLDGLSYLEMARVEAARGDAGSARKHYHRFLQRYDAPSPRMKRMVAEAQMALRSLE